jgi:osmotically inducible protein OsmC
MDSLEVEAHMALIKRKGQAIWKGNLRNGEGYLGTESGVVKDQRYSFATRFEQEPGTNPEELIAAAHAACYSMAFAGTLKENGFGPEEIETEATCTLTRLEEGGFGITKMELQVRGKVPDIDEATFEEMAHKADKGCPVSNLLRNGLAIEIDAALAE